jgi:hypothetical protein
MTVLVFVAPNALAKLQASQIRALAAGERNPQIACQLQRTLAGAIEKSNFLFESWTRMIVFDFAIVPRRQIKPEPVARAKVAHESKRCVGGSREFRVVWRASARTRRSPRDHSRK